MNCKTTQKYIFIFVSSYRGTHSYEAKLIENGIVGQTLRLSCRVATDSYEQPCTLSREEWVKQVNGKVGMVSTYPSEMLTDELVATFNRWLFDEWERDLAKIIGSPEVYGTDVPSLCPVFVGGRYDAATGWCALQAFDDLVKLAGLPAERCWNARLQGVTREMVTVA